MKTAVRADKNPRLVRDLSKMLERECGLYVDYLDILERERESITKFNAERVNELSAQRLQLTEELKAAKEERVASLDFMPESKKERLSQLIVQNCHPDDARRLMPLVQRLKNLVTLARAKAMEFNQVASYSLSIVNGSISILWSATQNVVRSYDPLGTMKESYNPATSRAASVLRSA